MWSARFLPHMNHVSVSPTNGPHKDREKLWPGWELNRVLHGQRLQKGNPSLYLYMFIVHPILGFTCKISLTISFREVLSMSVNDSVKLVNPNSFLRLRKVFSETRRFLAMAAQRNPAPLRSTFNKSSEISSLGRPGTPDLTTPTLAVESCFSSSACKAK